jgi:hypothetical protein
VDGEKFSNEKKKRKKKGRRKEEEKKKRKKGKKWQARTGEDKPSDERNPDVIWTNTEVGLHGAIYNKILKPRSRARPQYTFFLQLEKWLKYS